MSFDRIYKIPSADAVWDDLNPLPPQSVQIAVDAPNEAYLVGEGGQADWDALPSTLVGSWDADTGLQEGQSYDEFGGVIGTPTYPVTSDYAGWIRPLGNETGRATGILDSPRWQGHVEQKFLEDDKRYPDTDAPFQLKLERVYHPGGEPAYPVAGWGWTVTMVSDDPLRDITARAVGIYSDPECTAYLYTTGAFINEGGTYLTRCPPGQVQPTDAQVNFALLLGSLQEGYFNIPEGAAYGEALFWTKDQGALGEWQSGVAYAIGDEVAYLGIDYRCIQAHTSQVGWQPPNVPALWAVI